MNNKVLLGVIAAIIIIVAVIAFAGMGTTEQPVVENTNTTVNTNEGANTNGTDAATSTAATTTNTTGTKAGVSTNVGISTGSTKTLTVDGNNFKFAPSTLNVKKGDKVTIIFKNTGGFHDLVIDEYNVRTKQISGNAQDQVTFTADKAGTFEYYCSVGTHRQMGMKGTLVVSGL